jgi:hypothetical protein
MKGLVQFAESQRYQMNKPTLRAAHRQHEKQRQITTGRLKLQQNTSCGAITNNRKKYLGLVTITSHAICEMNIRNAPAVYKSSSNGTRNKQKFRKND